MPKPGSRTETSQPPLGGWIVMLFVIAFVAWVWRWQSSLDDSPVVDPNDKHEIQLDTNPDDKTTPSPTPNPGPSADLKDCVLIAVFDKKSIAQDAGYTATIQNDTFWQSAKAIVKDVEFLEDDDTTGKAALVVAKQPAPVVFLFNAKAKQVVWAMPLPKGGVSEIEKRLK